MKGDVAKSRAAQNQGHAGEVSKTPSAVTLRTLGVPVDLECSIVDYCL
jgi:hypothetical protein